MDMEPAEVGIWLGWIRSCGSRAVGGRRGWMWWRRRGERGARVLVVVLGWFYGESELRRDKLVLAGLGQLAGSTKYCNVGEGKEGKYPKILQRLGGKTEREKKYQRKYFLGLPISHV